MPKEALMMTLNRRVMRTLGELRCVVSLLQDQVSSRTKTTSLLWRENADSYLLSLKNTFPTSGFLSGHRF